MKYRTFGVIFFYLHKLAIDLKKKNNHETVNFLNLSTNYIL